MKTKCSYFFIFLLALSCNSVDNVGFDGLSEDDKAYYRQKEEKQCLSDTAKEFEDFSEDSNEAMAKMEREQSYSYKLALKNTTTTNVLKVWKVTESTVYFVHKLGDETDNYTFIKISASSNSALIDNIRTELCKKPDNYEFTNNNPPTIKKTELRPNTSDTRIKTVTQFLYKSNLPAYFATFNQIVSTRITDSSGDDTDTPSPKTYKTVPTTDNDAGYEYTSYTGYENAGARYCVVTVPVPISLPYEFAVADCSDDPTDGNGPAAWLNPGDDLRL